MKLVSKLALAALFPLATAPSVVVAAKPAPAPAAPKLSAPFRAAFVPAQTAIKAGDTAKSGPLLDALDAVAKDPYEKYLAAAIRLQLAGVLKDKDMQARAITAMIASGSAPAEDLPRLHFYAGNFAYEKNDLATASRELAESDRLGFKSADLYLLLAETSFKQNQVAPGLAYVQKAVDASQAAGTKAPENWYARALSVAYKAKMPAESSQWARALVRAYPTADNWRSALVIYRDSGAREASINLDLYRLMRMTKSLDGERDYYEYASFTTDRGLPGETKAVVDEGFASGKVPAGSKALTELRTLATGKLAADRASLATSEKQAGTAANGRLASNTGDAYLGYGDYPKAIALYKLALQKGGADVDAVNTRLGIALAQSGDKEGARAAFSAVKGARAEVAQFWLLYLDQAAA